MDKVIDFVPYDKNHLEEPTGPFSPGDTITINMAVPMKANSARIGAAQIVTTAMLHMTLNGSAPKNDLQNISFSIGDPTPTGPAMWSAVLTCTNGDVQDCMIQIGVSLPKGHPAK